MLVVGLRTVLHSFQFKSSKTASLNGVLCCTSIGKLLTVLHRSQIKQRVDCFLELLNILSSTRLTTNVPHILQVV